MCAQIHSAVAARRRFFEWVISENKFCNTLVDRIVTGYPKDEAETLCREIGWNDQLLDTAEIFHLWVIEGDFEDELPLCKAGFNVVWTNDVSPYKNAKFVCSTARIPAWYSLRFYAELKVWETVLKMNRLTAFCVNVYLNT